MKISYQKSLPLTGRALQRFAILAVVYVGLVCVLPVSSITMHEHHLSALQYRVILLCLALPALAAWFAAFYGYATLREYAHSVHKTPEGIYFDQLATGCSWLALSLPLPAITGLVVNALADRWPHFHPAAIIITNYASLYLPLIAFSLIGVASRRLVSKAKLQFNLITARLMMVLFLIAGVMYCFLTFRQFNLASLHGSNNGYFLPLWLAIFTVVIPYLYAWFVGLLAAYEITLYSRQVQGLLYRRALRLVVGGLVAVIASSIARQYLGGVQPRVGHLVFDYRLLLSALFSIVGGAGFVVLAFGARRLKKIEEV